ncbi:MAG: tetratricopeptide repeat protein, partial [Ignavibacteria bacterium]
LIRWLILKDVPERETYFYFYGKDFLTTASTMLQTLPLYFRLLFVPVGLLYHYNGYLPYQNSFLNFNVIFAIVFIVVMLAAAVYLLKRLPLISFCIFFFFISLVPVLNIIPTMNFMAERFLYLPSIIMSIAVVELVFKFYTTKNQNILYIILFLIIISFSYLTIKRNSDWKDNDTLFLSAEGKPGTVTYVNIGNIYANKQQIDIAETYYRKAIDIRDETLLANNNLGKVFLVRGNFDSAYYYINKAYWLDTLSPEPIFTLAQLYANNNMLPEAVYQLEKVQKITPNYMNSIQMLEQLKMRLLSEGKKDAVINPEITRLERESYKYYQSRNYDEAVYALEELIKLNPEGKSGYYNNMGMCYLEQGKLDDAEKYFLLSVEAKPDFSIAYNNLGVVYEKKGDMKKAKESFLKAVQSDPNNLEAKSNLERVK